MTGGAFVIVVVAASSLTQALLVVALVKEDVGSSLPFLFFLFCRRAWEHRDIPPRRVSARKRYSLYLPGLPALGRLSFNYILLLLVSFLSFSHRYVIYLLLHCRQQF